jgi:hypothetical protein
VDHDRDKLADDADASELAQPLNERVRLGVGAEQEPVEQDLWVRACTCVCVRVRACVAFIM